MDLAHTLVYKGMPCYINGNPATWYWILARIIESTGLVFIFAKGDRFLKAKRRWAYTTAFLCSILLISLVYRYVGGLPQLVIDDIKYPSSLKNAMEYMVSGFHFIMILIILFMYRRSKKLGMLWLLIAYCFLLLGELIFTSYKSIYGFNNALGHVYKALGYYFLLQGIFFTTIKDHFIRMKKAESAIREAEEKYRILVEESLTGVFIAEEGRLVYCNRRFASIFGYTQEEIAGEAVARLLQVQTGEARGKRKDNVSQPENSVMKQLCN